MADNTATPVKDIAKYVGIAVGLLSTVVTSAAGSGVLGVKLGDRVKTTLPLLALLPGVVSGVMVFIAANRVGALATPLVTPVANPKGPDGEPLRSTSGVGGLLTHILG